MSPPVPERRSAIICPQWIDGWPGLEGGSPKPRGFLRSAQSSPGHPIHQKEAVALADRLGGLLDSHTSL
jgi:hypothetical protein